MFSNHSSDQQPVRDVFGGPVSTIVVTVLVGLVVLSAVGSTGAVAAPAGSESASLQTSGSQDGGDDGNSGGDGDSSLCGVEQLPDRWDFCDAIGEAVGEAAGAVGSLANAVAQGLILFIHGLNGILAVLAFRALRQLSYSTFNTPHPDNVLTLGNPGIQPWPDIYNTVAPPDGPHFIIGLLILILGVYGRHTLRIFGVTAASKTKQTHQRAIQGVVLLIVGYWGLSVLFMLTDVVTHLLMPDIVALTEALGEQLPDRQEMANKSVTTRTLFNPVVTIFFFIWGIAGYVSLELLYWVRKILLFVVVWAYPIGVGVAYSGLPLVEDYARTALKATIPLTLLPVGGALVMRAFAFVVHNQVILEGRPSITLLLYLSFPAAVAFLSYKWFQMSSSVLAEGVERAKETPKKAVSTPMKYGKKAWRVGRRHRRRRRRERRHQERLAAAAGRSWSDGDTEKSFKFINYQIHPPGDGGPGRGSGPGGSGGSGGSSGRTIVANARRPGDSGPTVDAGATAMGSPQGGDPRVVGNGEPGTRAAVGSSVAGALDSQGAGSTGDVAPGPDPGTDASGSTSPTPQQAPGAVSGAARTSGAADYQVPRGRSWGRSHSRSESQFLPKDEDFEWLDDDDQQFRQRLAQHANQFENSTARQD